MKLTGLESGSCSGTQVQAPSGTSYVLTAGHCRALASKDGTILASTDTMTRAIPLRIVEESRDTDLLLLEGLPHLKGITVGEAPLLRSTLTSYTHGYGFQTYEAAGPLVDQRTIDVVEYVLEAPEDEARCLAVPKHKVSVVPFFIFSVKACVLHMDTYVAGIPLISPGSSGGFVGDSTGELVGVVSASDGKFAYLIPQTQVKAFLAPY